MTADLRLPKLMRLQPSRRVPLFNGALECRLFEIRVVAGRADVSKVATVSAAAGLDENFAVDPTQAAELDDASAKRDAT